MRPVDLMRLLLLAAFWGGSFLFMRVAAPAFGPILMVEIRVSVAGLVLLCIAKSMQTPLEVRTRWPQYLAIGAMNSAIPFALIAASELHLTASMAAILNATSPLFGAILSAIWLKEALTAGKLFGIVVAVTGVVILVGGGGLTLDGATLLAVGASLSAAFFYGLAGAYTKANVRGASPFATPVGSLLGASLLLLPLTPFVLPRAAPSLSAVLCLLTLTLLSTAWAYLLYFRLIADVGPTKALTVTFLVPIFGTIWGALFLGEAIPISKLIGGGVILIGSLFVIYPASLSRLTFGPSHCYRNWGRRSSEYEDG